MRALALTALLCAGCVIVMNEQVAGPDAGLPDGGRAGGGGGGGGGGSDLDGDIGWGSGGGGGSPVGFPGSGAHGDSGATLVLFFRIDRGTANLAAAEDQMSQTLVDSLDGAGLKVSAVLAVDLSAGALPFWQSYLNGHPGITLADALRARAAQAGTPSACTTQGVLDFGRASGVGTRAVMVAVVDHGPRPLPVACDGLAAAAEKDPNSWLRGQPLARPLLRYLFISTPEAVEAAQMQSACLTTAGFPPSALDALSPSPQIFFDAMAPRIDAAQPQLATRVDLCEALGRGWPARADEIAAAWAAVLQAQP